MTQRIPTPVPSHGKGQREAILAEAAALFARHGYHGTAMSDLAEACGLSKATLYHHYRDKSEVLTHIADGHVSRLVELCESVKGDPAVAPDDRLAVLVERFLAEYSEAQNSHRVLTEDVRFLPAPDRKRILDQERRGPAPPGSGKKKADQAARDAAVRHVELDVHVAAADRSAHPCLGDAAGA